MCISETSTPSNQLTKKEQARQQKFSELHSLFNLASGAYFGSTTSIDPELAKRCLLEMEKMVLGTAFSGGS